MAKNLGRTLITVIEDLNKEYLMPVILKAQGCENEPPWESAE